MSSTHSSRASCQVIIGITSVGCITSAGGEELSTRGRSDEPCEPMCTGCLQVIVRRRRRAVTHSVGTATPPAFDGLLPRRVRFVLSCGSSE